MWVLIILSLFGSAAGAYSINNQTHVHSVRFYNEDACNKAAQRIIQIGSGSKRTIHAFCVNDDISNSVLKGLEGVEKGLDNSFGKTKKK